MATDFDQFINRMLGGLNNVSPTPVAPPAAPSAPVYQSPVQATATSRADERRAGPESPDRTGTGTPAAA